MSIFLELLRCFLCCEDEHDYDYQTSHENSFPESHPYNQLPLEPIFHGHDLDDEIDSSPMVHGPFLKLRTVLDDEIS